MDVSALQSCHPRDDRSPPPKPTTPRDNDGDSILLDTYFDHSRPLDSQAFDDLLATKFGDDQSEASTKTITQWRPAHSIEEPQLHEAATTTKMESFDQYDTHHAIKPPYSALASPVIQQQQMFGLPLHAAPDYQRFQSRRYQPSPYGQRVPTHQLQPQHIPPGNMPSHVGQYYSHSGPVAMPTMGDSYHDMPTSQPHYNEYYSSPENGSRQGTADLMDYDNSIPEEDESGDNVNGEIADPCYAQLLFRCLREAPDHTLSLKQVYEWVRKHSQKARDSSGTGWQNSVRHNLSMNAVSLLVSSAIDCSLTLTNFRRLSSASLLPLSMAQRKAPSGASTAELYKKVSSPRPATAKTLSVSQSAVPLLPSSVKAPAQKVDRPLVQPHSTEKLCRLAPAVCQTSTVSSDTDVTCADKSRPSSRQSPCPPHPARPPHRNRAGCPTAFQPRCLSTTHCLRAHTTCSRSRPTISP